jgi:uncharacterized coiled-coil DUF342 family protein
MSKIKRFHSMITEQIDILSEASEKYHRDIDAEFKAIRQRVEADKQSYKRIDVLKEQFHETQNKLLGAQQELRELSKELPAKEVIPLSHPEEQ